MKKIKTIILILLVIAIVVIILFVFELKNKPIFEGQKEFIVLKGESLNAITQNLYQENLITSKFAFESYMRLKGWQSSAQAGIYIITPMNISEVAKMLVAGEAENETIAQIIEGWTSFQIANYLTEKRIISQPTVFLDNIKTANWQNDFGFLDTVGADNIEGFLFPDTYRIFKDADVNEIIAKMLNNFDDKLTVALRTEINARGRNIYDVIKMASIIEQEVPDEDERKIVAGILWKRLDDGMLLQVDSSLKYIIGKKNNASLTFDELKIDSLYNTYKYQGLPPTPICNPGESAIRAAIYPKNSDYWFYLSDKTGKTIFSKDLDEHNQNIQKYLK